MKSSVNQKYITYHNAVRGGPSHGHGQHAQKFGEVRPRGFLSHTSGHVDKQTYSLQFFKTLIVASKRVTALWHLRRPLSCLPLSRVCC